jgi:hypothetical protein
MATWNSYVLTKKGEALLASTISEGKTLTITMARTSAKDYTGAALAELEALEDVKQEFKPDSITAENDVTSKIAVTITNISLIEAYTLNTIGIYANNGGEDVLFCVATAAEAETMPAYDGGVIKEIAAKIYITTASSKYITIDIDMEQYVTAEACKDMIYPVGAVYLAVGGKDPATLFGGKWQQIIGRYIRASGTLSGTTYTAGESGGEVSHTITTDELPAHSHTRGTMNITGTFSGVGESNDSPKPILSGAFYVSKASGGITVSNDGSKDDLYGFDASKSWTGSTSVVGKSKAIGMNPAYFVIDMWVRIA